MHLKSETQKIYTTFRVNFRMTTFMTTGDKTRKAAFNYDITVPNI